MQLFVPFVCGKLLQPFIGGWIGRHDGIVGAVDQGSILLIVYSAVSEGLWHQVPPTALDGLVVTDGILLGAALITTGLLSKWLGFNRADRVAIIFCGSKKSLSQGVTMAKVIFASYGAGAMILPLMVFHQIQLMVCAALAQRWGRRAELSPRPAPGPLRCADDNRPGELHLPVIGVGQIGASGSWTDSGKLKRRLAARVLSVQEAVTIDGKQR